MRYKNYLNQNIADLSGQIIVVTGANSGLGFEATRYLSYKGATIVMACRNIAKAEVSKQTIINENPEAKLDIIAYDQADFASIDAFIGQLKSKYRRIHALVCNAGIYYPQRNLEMKSGLKLTIGTNFIGLYYLLRQITPYLDVVGAPTRVIFVSSLSAYHQRNKAFKAMLKPNQSLFRQYANSKLAIFHFFHVLANGMNLHDFQDRKNVSFFLMHPGVTATHITDNFPNWLSRLAHGFLQFTVHHVDKAALGIVTLAGAQHVFNGSYIVPRGIFEISGFPRKRSFPKRMVRGSGQFIYDVGKYVRDISK
jgi:NAD(P)-dependent dehydrogenase (short-subunit alcohol dehydrogenase family)